MLRLEEILIYSSVYIVDLDKRYMRVVTEVAEWPRTMRRASLNSFGYGGANAHAILESMESYLSRAQLREICTLEVGQTLLVLPVSAVSKHSLEVRTTQVSSVAKAANNVHDLGRIAHTLARCRSHFNTRSFCIAQTKKSESGGLEAEFTGWSDAHTMNPLPVVFIFSGQGAQWVGMGKEPLQLNDVFFDTIRNLDGVLQRLPPQHAPCWTIEQSILDSPETSQIGHSARSQPICTAIQIALVNVLRTWGIIPSDVVGHSSGEIAGAYAAGLLNEGQAVLVAYFRGYACTQLLDEDGAMIAVGFSEMAANSLVEDMGLHDQVCVACVNAPESVTLSGASKYIHTVQEELRKRRIFYRLLETGGRAYHSPIMKKAGELYENLVMPHLQGSQGRHTEVKMHSTAGYSGEELPLVTNRTEMAKYWRENLEKPVQFNAVLSKLFKRQAYQLIEIGPHRALKGPINQIRASLRIDEQHVLYLPTLTRNEDSNLCVKQLAATLFLHGHTLDWSRVNQLPADSRVPVDYIPPYPWDYSAGLLWAEPRASIEMRHRLHKRHELLGSCLRGANGIDYHWRNVLHMNEIPWIRDHKVEDKVVFPAACYLAVAIEAISQITYSEGVSTASQQAFEFLNVSIHAALVLPDVDSQISDNIELHTAMSPRKLSTRSLSKRWYDFRIYSWTRGKTTDHCAGSICIAEPLLLQGTTKIEDTIGYRGWEMSLWYEKAEEEGLSFGPYFQSVVNLLSDSSRARSDITCGVHTIPVTASNASTRYPVHPITIDACLQSSIISATNGNLRLFRPYLPTFISRCRIQPHNCCNQNTISVIHTRSQKTGFSTLRSDCTMMNAQGEAIIDWEGIRLSMYTNLASRETKKNDLNLERHPALRVYWKPDISRLCYATEGQLTKYISSSVSEICNFGPHDTMSATVEVLLDLAGHKNPRMRILQLGDTFSESSDRWSTVLHRETAFPRCRSWTLGSIEENGDVTITGDRQTRFDVLILGVRLIYYICFK